MLTFFGGKGGVGKTTCAAAWSLARAAAGTRVLVLSTDPAHSLADAFDRLLGRRVPTRVAHRLDALELDAQAAVARWLRQRRPALGRLLDRGTLLDREDIQHVLSMPIPGLDELAAFITIADLTARRDYTDVVVDTAPTGHTLRLLDAATVVAAFTELLAAMHDRHAMVAQALGGDAGRSELVESLRATAADVETRLHDPARTQLIWVTMPEPVVVAETLDAIEWLDARRLPLSAVVVNRLTAPERAERARGCLECRARAAYERIALEPIVRRLRKSRPPVTLRSVPAYGDEPRGPRALRAFGRALTGPPDSSLSTTGAGRRPRVTLRPPGQPGASPVLTLASARLLFFGGKGGMGKTTCATAAAISIGEHFPSRAIRLLSTDPASSLADVLSIPIGDRWTPVPGAGRLEACEIDAAARLDEFRRQYGQAVEAFFDDLRGGSSFDAAADRTVFARLFDLAPPGLDELAALVTVADVLDTSAGALVIVDTAPTGHTLRLLAAQDDLRRWIALLMRLLVKYRLAARAEPFARDLVTLSRRLRAFGAVLADPGQARFVAVLRPGALPRLETVRLLRELRRLRVSAPTVIVNAETAGTCSGCARRASAESRQLGDVRRACRGKSGACDMMHAPLQLPPPRGTAELLRWSRTWRSDGDT